MSSTPTASPSGPWRLSASLRAVLLSWQKEYCSQWGAGPSRPGAGVLYVPLAHSRRWVLGRDAFSWQRCVAGFPLTLAGVAVR